MQTTLAYICTTCGLKVQIESRVASSEPALAVRPVQPKELPVPTLRCPDSRCDGELKRDR